MSISNRDLINELNQKSALLSKKTAVIGFDGFVDSIMRLVKSKNDKNTPDYFQTMAEFGTRIIEKQGMSCSIELEKKLQKLGGNAPIMANALGYMGISVKCVGALGFPEMDSAFKEMSPNCALYGFTGPGLTTALEFDDGKIMMSQPHAAVSWQNVKDIIGLQTINDFFCNADVLGMVNWSEAAYTVSIWEGIIKDILPGHTPNKKQIMFFDLSDFSKRSKEDVKYAVKLIEKFAGHYNVTLGLNENEARLMYSVLNDTAQDMDLHEAGCRLFERIKIDRLVVHPTKYALGWDKSGTYRADNRYIEKPVLSTGGGDNFNAGFCLGALLGISTEMSLHVANHVSGYYVSHGHSPQIKQLIEYIGSI